MGKFRNTPETQSRRPGGRAEKLPRRRTLLFLCGIVRLLRLVRSVIYDVFCRGGVSLRSLLSNKGELARADLDGWAERETATTRRPWCVTSSSLDSGEGEEGVQFAVHKDLISLRYRISSQKYLCNQLAGRRRCTNWSLGIMNGRGPGFG